MKLITLLFCILFFSFSLSAQDVTENEKKMNVELYNLKINELFEKHSANGFVIYKEQKLKMHSTNDMVITLSLQAGTWYHFAFVGDPISDKIKIKLSNDEYGDFVIDRILKDRDHEFWSEFSYICNKTGIYHITLFQKAPLENPLAYLTIFKKSGQQKEN